MKLLLVGGHLTPALAFIDYLQAKAPEVSLVFLGRLYARKQSKQLAHEKTEVEKRGVMFVPFDSGKLIAAHPVFQLVHLALLVITVPLALIKLIQLKPSVVLCFGGYLGVPISLAAWVLRIPIVTHEQTRGLGLANRLISFFAKKTALSHKESLKFVAKSKAVVTGNPVRRTLFTPNPTKPAWITKNIDRPIIYITGGSQGSEIINSTIAQLLETLTKQWVVIHQCGAASTQRNYKKELLSAAQILSKKSRDRYNVREWVADQELAWIYQQAQIVISRSGANTVEELCRFAIPSILIPLPFAHQQEQLKNAEAMKRIGGAVIIDQKSLDPKTLFENIDQIHKRRDQMSHKLHASTGKLDACDKLFALIQDVQE